METVLRKRKSPSQDGEILSKKLKRLNLERNAQNLYIPRPPAPRSPPPKHRPAPPLLPSTSPDAPDYMQLDNTKYKVYIHSIDDELSSDDSDSPDAGKLVFLPDIEKRIRSVQIPPSLSVGGFPAEAEGKDRQLVLYNVPCSLTLPVEEDSVRKAILETRQRMRERVRQEEAEAFSLSRSRDWGPAPDERFMCDDDVSAPSVGSMLRDGTFSGAVPSLSSTIAEPEGSSEEMMMVDDDDDADAMDLDLI